MSIKPAVGQCEGLRPVASSTTSAFHEFKNWMDKRQNNRNQRVDICASLLGCDCLGCDNFDHFCYGLLLSVSRTEEITGTHPCKLM